MHRDLELRQLRLVHYFYSTQILYVMDAWKARNQQPQRESLLPPNRLPILAIDDQHIVHRLGQRNTVRELYFVCSLRNDPACALLQSDLAE
jgi:hypothetical protein